MKLYLVKERDRMVWVAALANEVMYSYVANTGKFHDNNALRNDFYMERHFSYTEIGTAQAQRLINDDLGRLDESTYAEALTEWRADPKPLDPTEVLSMAAGFNP
ncbi:hypothetical protein OHA70_01925 [Kribbella sp. NBC_00382]|uniref:hypothetical protein n=1 Tax=Kribbella sp. NBC_00382 TaxID=2975967 RepID=UPI002E23CAA7